MAGQPVTRTGDGLLSSTTGQSYQDGTTDTYDANGNLSQTDDPYGQVTNTVY
ncbi:MAG: hypothetical protein ACRDZ8_11775 [Acidimicrobiales bacterium]